MSLFQRWGLSRLTATGVGPRDRGERSPASEDRGWGGNHKWLAGAVVTIRRIHRHGVDERVVAEARSDLRTTSSAPASARRRVLSRRPALAHMTNMVKFGAEFPASGGFRDWPREADRYRSPNQFMTAIVRL